jgi:hypothetical protein
MTRCYRITFLRQKDLRSAPARPCNAAPYLAGVSAL